MSEIIRAIESEQLKKDLPKFNVGRYPACHG